MRESKLALSRRVSPLREKIAEHKTIAQNHISGFNLYFPRKRRPGIDKRMEFSILSAAIYCARQILQKCFIEFTTQKFRRQLSGIDTGDLRADAGGDHFLGEYIGWQIP